MWGWHFVRNDYTLEYDRSIKVKPGLKLSTKETPVLCKVGFHASERILDALRYAPGDILCRVQLSGQIIRDTDKAVAQSRRIEWIFDAERVLHEFACVVAEDALKKAKVTDERCWNAIQDKRDWLAGKINDEQMTAAWDAARDAAWDAAETAARDAARAAAWEAAWAAARAAARAAAWEAAWDAARAAAWDAAWGAARAAARDEHNELLTKMVMAQHRKER